MSSLQATSPSPVVLLRSVSANLSPEAIAELVGVRQNAEDLVLEPINTGINDEAAIIDDADWFQAHPSASTSTPRLSSGGKNMKAMLKSLRLPSPTPSDTSVSQSTAADYSDDDWSKFIEEEQQRRAEEEARRVEWCRRAVGRRRMLEAKLNKAR